MVVVCFVRSSLQTIDDSFSIMGIISARIDIRMHYEKFFMCTLMRDGKYFRTNFPTSHIHKIYSRKTIKVLYLAVLKIALGKMKLNLGCGNKKLEGFLNIDSYEGCNPDKVMDLKAIPYPFEENSCTDICMRNIIEHLPSNPDDFFSVLKEIYRISKPNARVFVRCPHPNHRWQVGDLTHQKALTQGSFMLLSKKENLKNINAGSSRTPLALIYDIDFELVKFQLILDGEAENHIKKILGSFDLKLLESYLFLFNNIAAIQEATLLVKK